MLYEKTELGCLFSNDKNKLQAGVIYNYLSRESYWAKNIPAEKVMACIAGSDCFGIYHTINQVGFARVITDHASFAYLADVFLLEPYRNKGLSSALLRYILAFGPYQGLRRFMLATKDAHGLYAKFGFKALSEPERFMELQPFETYPA